MDNVLADTHTTDSDATHPTASPDVCDTELKEKARYHAVQALTFEHICVRQHTVIDKNSGPSQLIFLELRS